MKLLDVIGTSSESFSIGSGEKKIEFKTIDGVFYFRNFGTGWQKASSEILKDAVKLRTWSSGLTLNQDELFLYNQALWSSKITFQTLTFSDDSKNFVKIADLSNFTKINVLDTPYYLESESSDTVYIEGQSTNDLNVFLPDSRTLHIGRTFLFVNGSNTKTNIFKKGTSEYDSIGPGESASLLLTQNIIESGTWSKINLGGINSAGAFIELKVTLNPILYPSGNQFNIGDAIYYNYETTRWEKAYVGDFDLNMLGLVTFSESNIIIIKFFGEIEVPNPLSYNGIEIVPGEVYYLTDDPNNPGIVTSTPTVLSPTRVFVSISTTKILVLNVPQKPSPSKVFLFDITDGDFLKINTNETGLMYKMDGYVNNDSRMITFNGLIMNGTFSNARIDTTSDLVWDYEITPGLCFLDDGTDLIIKNNLGSDITLVITVETFKQI